MASVDYTLRTVAHRGPMDLDTKYVCNSSAEILPHLMAQQQSIILSTRRGITCRETLISYLRAIDHRNLIASDLGYVTTLVVDFFSRPDMEAGAAYGELDEEKKRGVNNMLSTILMQVNAVNLEYTTHDKAGAAISPLFRVKIKLNSYTSGVRVSTILLVVRCLSQILRYIHSHRMSLSINNVAKFFFYPPEEIVEQTTSYGMDSLSLVKAGVFLATHDVMHSMRSSLESGPASIVSGHTYCGLNTAVWNNVRQRLLPKDWEKLCSLRGKLPNLDQYLTNYVEGEEDNE